MSATPQCDATRRQWSAEQYVARRMAPQDAEAFEDHFVTCKQCQDEVRFASSVVGAVGVARSDAPPRERPRRRWFLGGGAIALAAGLTALMILRAPSSELAALGGVREPPMYLGIPVRSQDARPDSAFDVAMDAYARKDFREAASGLRAMVALNPGFVPAEFFLAASLLLDDHPRDAADAFERVIARGDTPYHAEARYYRAKALLRMGRAADAQSELQRIAASSGAMFEMARALADSVSRLRNR